MKQPSLVTAITMATAVIHAGPLVYEAFDYEPVNDSILGRVAGRNGGTGWGGPWLDSVAGSNGGAAFVYDSRGNPADLYGGTYGSNQPNWDAVVNNLPSKGGYAGLSDWTSEAAGNDRLNSHRPLAMSAGEMAASNGGVLWLSAVWHMPNQSLNPPVGIALASGNSHFADRAQTLTNQANGAASGNGIGVGHGSTLAGGGRLNPVFWENGRESARTLGPTLSSSSDNIVILKFEFGATDTIRAAFFTEHLEMTEEAFNANAVSATSTIDEFSLTTLTFSTTRKENAVDEFRIGHTFADVTTVPPVIRQSLEITDISRDPVSGEISLTWKSNPGENYGIQWSTDLKTFYPSVHQSIPAQATATHTSYGPFPAPVPMADRLFLRVGPPDVTPPALLAAGGGGDRIVLTWSEPLLAGSATDPANYLIEKTGGGAVTILSAVIGDDPRTVVLKLASSLEEGASYSVTAANVADPAGLSVASGNQAGFTSWSSPYISEFMASNGNNRHQTDVLLDGDGDSSDWIEIVNPTADSVNLDGWHLTDDAANLGKWRIPAVTLAPGEHLIIFASGKNRTDPAAELHANFNLSVDGEYLALVRLPGEGLASEFAPAFPIQTTGISYGLLAGSATEFRFFDQPTPWFPNAASGYLGLVADTKFSVDRGFHAAPIAVELTTATPDATIRYTVDMTEPSLTNGQTATPGVPIAVSTTTCLRARAFKTGWLPSNSDTHTYIFPSAVMSQPGNPEGFPANWNSATADYDMDPAVIARYSAQELENALKSLPSISIVTPTENLFSSATGIYSNYQQKDELWERPTSMEWIDPDGGREIQLNCGLRLQGGAARIFPKKPFRMLFKGIYGPTKLDFPVFPESPGAVASFDTLILRSNSQDQNWGAVMQITDENGRRTLLDMGTPQSHGTYVHLFVNGLYWGLYNAVERPQASFCADYFGGTKDEWDVNNGNEAVDGSYAPFDNMLAQVRGGPATDAAYRKIEGRFPDGTDDPASPAYIDMPNYIDYMLCNFYLGTGDWAGNASQGTRNYYCGRRRTDDSPGYHWFVWDAERSLQNTIPTGVIYGPAEPHAWLKNNAEYRLRFADHAQRHLRNGGALSAERRQPVFTALADRVRAAMILEEARWDQSTVAGFETHIASRTAWFPNRAANVISHFKTQGLFPQTEAPVFSQHGGSVSIGTPVTMSTDATAIYYTLDGSDPRLFGGSVAPTAIAATLSGGGPKVSETLFFSAPTTLKARSFNEASGEWSALNEAFFRIDMDPASAANLVISEIHYHPADPATSAELAVSPDKNEFEFIELLNIGPLAVDLTGVSFSLGITFAFPDGTSLPAGARLVLVRNLAAFTARYGTPAPGVVAGEFSGNLSNGGERLVLASTATGVIQDFNYGDAQPWPASADGLGYSLVLLNPASNPDHALPANWAASAAPGGTPGTE